jgi:hypothetical protein
MLPVSLSGLARISRQLVRASEGVVHSEHIAREDHKLMIANIPASMRVSLGSALTAAFGRLRHSNEMPWRDITIQQ